MATKDDTRTRAPRGTRNVAQAFFTALDALSVGQQAAVATAALASIRDALKARRLKAREAAAKAKAKAPAKTKAPAPRKAKAAAKRVPAAAKKAAAKKTPAKRAVASKPAKRKSPRKPVSPPAPEAAKE
jgi:hypothetical protein